MKMLSIERILALSHKKAPDRRVYQTPTGYTRAAVLVPVIDADGGPFLLFTKRTGSVETHKGHISFPGGVVDSLDVSIEDTALREAFEEIGLHRSSVSITGILDDITTPTGFVITPVVGVVCGLPDLSISPEEVEEVFQVPLAHFADDNNGRTEVREVRGKRREVWFYETQGYTIWGATAHIIRSMIKVISEE